VIYFIFRFRLSGMKSESMTLNEKIMVQGTSALLAPIADVAAELFYGRLFEIDPTLKTMFVSI